MNPYRARARLLSPLVGLVVLVARTGSAQVTSTSQTSELSGTSWQLVKFQGGDGEIVLPGDKSKYTISFGNDNRLTARIDCNRGNGSWKSEGRNQLEPMVKLGTAERPELLDATGTSLARFEDVYLN